MIDRSRSAERLLLGDEAELFSLTEGVDQRSSGRALNDALLAALERRDVGAAQEVARALAELLALVKDGR